MMNMRPAAERGHTRLDWLDSDHSFSFGEYFDPDHMGVSNLRVLNEDRIAPGAGFATHGHRDMEIVTYVISGAVEHRDDAGHQGVIRPDEVQRMSAGAGIRHSEYNPSQDEPVHLLQIWLEPNATGGEPSYAEQAFAGHQARGRLQLLVSPDGREGSLSARQHGLLYRCRLTACEGIAHRLEVGDNGYLHVIRGRVEVEGYGLGAGDGLRIEHEPQIRFSAQEDAELLLFDLP
jgi:redox-sensitive bicupin YhaK (pirin superfamily)